MTTITSESTGGARNRNTDYRAQILAAWQHFQAVAKMEQRDDLVVSLEPAINRFELGLFRLVIMGEIKKGKSSFINALLGEPDLLPTASDVATSTVFKLIYGPERRFKVFFQRDVDTNRRPEPREIPNAALQDYGTETGNPKNAKRVDFIGIELPHPLLKEGLVIVDTPGVGGLFKAHRDITWRYAPNADAICFVLDSTESVISKDELEFLKELTAKVTKKLFFVQTKLDATSTEQWQTWEQRNREHLTKNLSLPAEELLYFAVSSKRKSMADKHPGTAAVAPEDAKKLLKHLERSGFSPVMRFLREGLMKQKEKYLAQQTARQLLTGCAELDRLLRGQLRIAQAESKEALDSIAQELKAAERAMTEWERETYPTEMRRFQDEFASMRLQISGRLRAGLEAAVSVNELINQLQVSDFDPKILNQRAGQFQQELLSRASEAALAVDREFHQAALVQVDVTANRLAKGFRMGTFEAAASGTMVPIPHPRYVQDTLHMKFGMFEKVQRGMMGLGVGVGLATLVTVIFPPAAAIGGLLALAAGYFGATKGLEQLEQQKRDQAVNALQRHLTETMMRAQSQSQQHFAEVAQQLEKFARDTFDQAAKRARTDLQNRLRDVGEARVRNSEEAQAKVRELQTRLQRVAQLTQALGGLALRKQAALAAAQA